MSEKNLTFSVNQHDGDVYDGDAFDECVLLHINDETILRFDTPEQLEKFADDIKGMMVEIRENL